LEKEQLIEQKEVQKQVLSVLQGELATIHRVSITASFMPIENLQKKSGLSKIQFLQNSSTRYIASPVKR